MSVGFWTMGYRAALDDMRQCAASRGIATPALTAMLDDLAGDGFVIEREEQNRLQRKRLRAAREAQLSFEDVSSQGRE